MFGNLWDNHTTLDQRIESYDSMLREFVQEGYARATQYKEHACITSEQFLDIGYALTLGQWALQLSAELSAVGPEELQSANPELLQRRQDAIAGRAALIRNVCEVYCVRKSFQNYGRIIVDGDNVYGSGWEP